MELKRFEGMKKDELSMIEVAYAILEEKGDVLEFDQLLVEVQEYLELSDEELENRMVRFYTDLNIDGSFISLGENRWGLRAWYPIDSIDEEIASSMEDEDTQVRRRKRKKVNAFGEDSIDYNDDDPEEALDLDDEELDMDDIDEDEDELEDELDAYRSDLSELGADEDLIDEVSPEEDLMIVDEDQLDEDFDDEEEEDEDNFDEE